MGEMAETTGTTETVESKKMEHEVKEDAATPTPAKNKKPGALQITSVQILNPRSLRLEFSNGAIRLFDRYRLRGPKYIPLMEEEHFLTVTTLDGDLHWESLNITCPAAYIYDRSVPYDDNATAKEYVRTRRDIIQERIAVILFPAMAIAGILGTVWWWINN